MMLSIAQGLMLRFIASEKISGGRKANLIVRVCERFESCSQGFCWVSLHVHAESRRVERNAILHVVGKHVPPGLQRKRVHVGFQGYRFRQGRGGGGPGLGIQDLVKV